ncbi:MAG TPA: fluoride efflux transporter CrcB [Gemmatimonadaceae bacterium]|nr:fluoride efflux transporter CrcB [Gemmatimonadaceae bacterium]
MLWFIAAGSAVGGVTRYLLGTLVQQRAGLAFPLGTLIINITGSLILGFVLRYALATPAISAEVRALLTTGFCGGYTTFSTFSYETIALMEEGQHLRASVYVLLSVVLGLAATFLGIVGAREVLALRERL